MESENTLSQVVVAIGTRPDVIKMWPVIDALEAAKISHKVWWSGQGGDIQPQFPEDAKVIKHGRCKWKNLTARNIAETIEDFTYFVMQEALDVELVLVHGDDATAYACAIAAHALDISIGHVEAGMRTYECDPKPEEQFRQVIGRLATLHFCPSTIEMGNLEAERTSGVAHVVGNTINDVLSSLYRFSVLVTCHRRENALGPTQSLLDALAAFEGAYKGYVEIEVIIHPNWQNRYKLPNNLTFTDPIRDHEAFLDKLVETDVVITDSGGLQEECAFLGTPCIVYRAETERKSLEEAELIVVTQDLDDIIDGLESRLADQQVYGKGDAAEKIVKIISEWLKPKITEGRRAAERATLRNQTKFNEIALGAARSQNPDLSDLCLPDCDCNRHETDASGSYFTIMGSPETQEIMEEAARRVGNKNIHDACGCEECKERLERGQDTAEKEVSSNPDAPTRPIPNFGRLSTDWHIWDNT